MAPLVVENVSKQFRQGDRAVTALNGVDLKVPQGQFLAGIAGLANEIGRNLKLHFTSKGPIRRDLVPRLERDFDDVRLQRARAAGSPQGGAHFRQSRVGFCAFSARSDPRSCDVCGHGGRISTVRRRDADSIRPRCRSYVTGGKH